MDERRHFVRYPCDMEVKISGASDDNYVSEACDISEEGICLLIPGLSYSGLSAAGSHLNSGDSIKIVFADAEGIAERSIVCSVAHGLSVRDGQYLVGLHFEDYRDEARQFINDHIERCQ